MPNMISVARIVFSLLLLCLAPCTIEFCAVYIICGISDIADGFLARRLNAEADFGSLLDSISDIVFVSVCFAKFWHYLHFTSAVKLLLISIIAVKVTSLAICAFKNKGFGFRHNVLNKVMGFLLFVSIPFLTYYPVTILLCIFAQTAAVDELIFNIKYFS